MIVLTENRDLVLPVAAATLRVHKWFKKELQLMQF